MSHTPDEHSERKGQSEAAPTTATCRMDGIWTRNTFTSVSCVTTVVLAMFVPSTLHVSIIYPTSAFPTNIQFSVT